LSEDLNQVLMLENDISIHIRESSSCFTHFEYEHTEVNEEVKWSLKVITFNRMHWKAFILKEFSSDNRISLLKDVLSYVKETMRTENNYTVHWTDMAKGVSHLSYFRGMDMNDVKSKFYCSTDNIMNIRIDKITLSPMA
jgi:hypothetical protein